MIENVNAQTLSSISVLAVDSDVVWATAGSFQLNLQFDLREDLGEEPRNTKPAKSYGVGIAICMQESKSSTTARMKDSILQTHRGGVIVQATDAGQYFSFAAAVAAGQMNVQAEGMFVDVSVDANSQATIDSGTLILSPEVGVTQSDLLVVSNSNPLLITAAGDLVRTAAASAVFAAGVAVAVVSGTIDSGASIKGKGTVRSKRGQVTVTSQSAEAVPDPRSAGVLNEVYTPNRDSTALWTFVVGVVSAKSANLAGDFSVISQSIKSNRKASIEGGPTVALERGRLIVESTDRADVYSGSGAITSAGGTKDNPNTAAVGAAFNRTAVSMETCAIITDSIIDVVGDPSSSTTPSVEVYSESKSSVWVVAVGAEVSGKVALGFSLSLAEVTHDVRATIGDLDQKTMDSPSPRKLLASIGGVSVRARDATELICAAGQVAIATNGVAGGAAAATSSSINKVHAGVVGYQVNVPSGELILNSDSSSILKTIAIGVAGVGRSENGWPVSLSGVGSGTENKIVRQVESTIVSSDVVSASAIHVRASDTSDVIAVAGVADFQLSGKSKVSVAVGTSAATNDFGSNSHQGQSSYVRSWVIDSKLNSQGAMEIAAVGTQKLNAWTSAGAGKFANEDDRVIGFNNAGSGSGNTIQLEVSAIVDGSNLNQNSTNSTDGLNILASNSPEIIAVSGGVSIAGAKSDGKGISVEIGAAATTNTINHETLALVRNNSELISNRVLRIAATSKAKIEAVAYGVAASIRKGTAGEDIDFAGAGTACINTIRPYTQASIQSGSKVGSLGNRISGVFIEARDYSTVTAGSGGISSLFSFGDSGQFGLSVGVSFTVNILEGDTFATIDDSMVYSSGTIDVISEFSSDGDDNIKSISVAGTLDLDVGGGGVLFPLVGSGNKNKIQMDIRSRVSDHSVVNCTSDFNLMALDKSVVYTNAGGVGLGLVFNKADLSGGVAIGAAKISNDIRNTVDAAVQASTVDAFDAIHLQSEFKPTVTSIAYGVALSATVSTSALSAAGSGASVLNTISSISNAQLENSDARTATGKLSIEAKDQSDIKSSAGAGSLAFAIGNAVSLAPGVVLLDTKASNTISATIANTADRMVVSGGDVSLSSESAGVYRSSGVAVAAAASVGEVAISFSGAGGKSAIQLTNAVRSQHVSGQLQAQGTIGLTASSRDQIVENTMGVGALSVGEIGASIGVSLSESEILNRVSAEVLGGSLRATSGDILIQSLGSHSIYTETVPTSLSVALGGAGAGGHAFSTDSSQLSASVTGKPILIASNGSLIVRTDQALENGKPIDAKIQSHAGAGVGGLAAIGAVVVEATDSSSRLATIGDYLDLRNVKGLQVISNAVPNLVARSTAVDLGGIAVNVNRSIANLGCSVVSSTGKGVYLPSGPVSVLAASLNALEVSQLGITGGVVAAGATVSEATNRMLVTAMFGNETNSDTNRREKLSVQAKNDDKTIDILTVAGTGGLFAGQGATGLYTDQSKTTVTLGSGEIYAGTVALEAQRNKTLNLGVNASTISVALGVGITKATYQDDSKVGVVLGEKSSIGSLRLVALDTITVSASNQLRRQEDSIWTKGIGGSGLESIKGVIAMATLNATSTISVEEGVSITSGDHPLARPGGIILLPSLSVDYQTHTNIANLSFLLSGSTVNSSTTGNLVSEVHIGNRVNIQTMGDLLIGNDATISASNQNAGWGSAVFSSVVDQSTSIDIHLDQKVTVGNQSNLSAVRNLSLTASQDPRTGQASSIDFRAHAITSSTSVLPAAQSKASAKLTEDICLDIGSGTLLESGANTLLHAGNSKPVFDVLGEASYYYLFVFRKQDYDSSSIHVPASLVNIRGSVLAGKENRLSIEIPNDRNNQFTNTVRVVPDQLYSIPLNSFIEQDPQFNPLGFIERQQVSPDISAALKAGVSSGDVHATKIGVSNSAIPIIVSGGSIYVIADQVSASNASLEARVAKIDIFNHSPNYLLLGSMMIANVLGGKVQFQSSRGDTLIDPVGGRIRRDTSTPGIHIQLDFPSSVGSSSNGPALFITKSIANLGGLVSIENATGSFGQFASIAAKEIDISTPNGVFAVDLPESNWWAAGSPAALYTRDSNLPLTYTADILSNAEHATMVGVNATYMEGLPNWRTAIDDTSLNNFVYGKPDDANRRVSWVFFGGSVPQDSKTGDGNSKAKNRVWAQSARIDQSDNALQLTDKTPKLGKNEGWDHAWVPSLQHVSVEGNLSTFASRNPSRMVQGQVVVIRAKTLNVNGTIQSGQSSLENHSIVLPESLEAKLLAYQRDYRRGLVSSPLLDIPQESLSVDKPGDRLIGARYDARNGQIEVDSVEASGGGSVQIIGRILNTDMAGKIKMTGGSGDITVRNRTSLQLNLGKLQTQSGGKKGVVSITDLNIADSSERQIAYVYNGTEILVYRGPDGSNVIRQEMLRDRILATNTQYQPQPGLRWNWQLEASVQRDVKFDLTNWSGVQASNWRFNPPVDSVNAFGHWSLVDGVDGGSLVTGSDPSAITQKMTSNWVPYPYRLGLTVPYENYGWDTGFIGSRTYYYPNSMDLGMQFSIKADYPIGIDFSQLRFGNVVVDSNGGVLLGGSVVAPGVQIVSHMSDIKSMFRDVSIDAGRISLSAKKSIGSATGSISITADFVDLNSMNGSIYIDANRNLDRQSVGIENIVAPLGAVVFYSNGPIVSGKAEGQIQGRQVDLWSRSGEIGTTLQPVRLRSPQNWGSLRINATSKGNVNLESFEGDLLVGLIEAQGGDVHIVCQGNVFSGESWTIDPERDLARLAALIATGATDPLAHVPDIQGFESRITQDYRLFWALRDSGDILDGVYRLRDSDIPLWRIRVEANLGQQGISDQDVRRQSEILFESLKESFVKAIGADWSTRPEFQARQPDYQYTASQQQIDQFKLGRTAAQAQLRIALLSSALQKNDQDHRDDKPSIRGRDLRITSRNGSIGKLDTIMQIPTANIIDGALTDNQLREINLATRPGDAFVDDSFSTLSLRVKRPLVIDISGRLDAVAEGNVIITDPSGVVQIGNIGSSNGQVVLRSEGSLLRAKSESLDFSGVTLGFEQPEKWRTLGTSGQTLNPFSGLFVPGNRNTVSATWYSDPITNSSFRASFTYLASTNDAANAGDGLAFVLRSENTDEVGNMGGQLGYGGLKGNKVGFLINLYDRNGEKRGTRFDTSGKVGSYSKSLLDLVNRPVYVSMTYDATKSTLKVSLGRSIDDRSPETTVYEGVDLQKLLGSQYFLGFTTATGDAFCSQAIQDFRFAISDSTQAQQVAFPLIGMDPHWVINRLANHVSDQSSGFNFVSNVGQNTLVFPAKAGIASSAWYENKVSIDGNFHIRFDYQFTSTSSLAGDGLALVFHNSPKALSALGGAGADLGYGSIDGPKVGLLLNLYGPSSG
ncbi:MAG: lectin-like domain-containing protein, partial [Pirellulaceae bacterium]